MSEPMPTDPASRLAARNTAIHAAEALFRAQAANIVSLLLRRAHGGDPVCLELCLERALPAGRIPPRLPLAPDYDPDNLMRVFGAIGAALDAGRINVRQASRLLDALGAPVRARPGVALVRKFADIEAGLAQALAALGMDDCLTVAPCGPGGILEHYQTKTEENP
jgi:hypothetical protein